MDGLAQELIDHIIHYWKEADSCRNAMTSYGLRAYTNAETSTARAVTHFQQRIFRHTPMLQHLTFDASSSSDLLHTLSLLLAMASLTSITVWTVELDKDFACPALNAELAGPGFRPLRRFSFLADSIRQALSPAMKALMPLANARGILD
ncbi:hypothetical protein DFH09DRAFT_1099517 [Mycena vulgaris]|nr:hypothetical protein DFH09DRAFT_1099517 [Mycena vulgaris]